MSKGSPSTFQGVMHSSHWKTGQAVSPAATSIGINPARARVIAFALSAGIAGLGGGLLAIQENQANYTANYSVLLGLLWLVIVVPVLAEGQVVGEIDIDATDPAAFDETDRIFLEEIAALLAPLRPRP